MPAIEPSNIAVRQGLPYLILRLAFASVFVVNGLSGWIDPFTASDLLYSSLWSYWLAQPQWLVQWMSLSDLLLGGFIGLARWSTRSVAALSLWLLSVTAIRLVALIPAGDPQEILGSLLDLINQMP